MTFNVKQSLRAAVVQQRRMLPNDIVFRKNKVIKVKVEGSMIV